MDDNMGFAAVTLKDRTDFNRSVADFISNSMSMENGAVYFSNAYSLGGKTVYKFEINNWNDTDDQDIPPEVTEKLTSIIDRLNGGYSEDNEEFAEEDTEDTYELTRGYK